MASTAASFPFKDAYKKRPHVIENSWELPNVCHCVAFVVNLPKIDNVVGFCSRVPLNLWPMVVLEASERIE